jgi:predicted DNA-binding protein with PD1-like motif
MRTKLLSEQGSKTFALVFDTGDEAMAGLVDFARKHHVSAAHFTAIGAFHGVTLGYFHWEKKDYKKIPLHEQVEVLSLMGDVSLAENGEPKIHAHVVVGRSDGTAWGGHLLEGHVRPTLEVVLTETPAHLQRRFDPASGLALIRF